MGRYLIRRLLWAVVLLWAVTIVSYVLFYIIPADPAQTACGQAWTQHDGQSVPLHRRPPLQAPEPRQLVLQPAAGEYARPAGGAGDHLTRFRRRRLLAADGR